MKALAILWLVGISACSAFAQYSKTYTACSNNAKTQAEMNGCAGAEDKRTDKELNDLYAQVLAKAARVPQALDKVKAAERAWIVFRDAYLEATYPAKDQYAEYGSIFPMDFALLRAKLTRQQILALRELLKTYNT